MMASKFGFFLSAFIAIPCIFEMSAILKFWLKNVPEYTVVFCSLVLIGSLTNQLTIGLQSAIQATGKIKIYQIVVGSILLFNLPISYVLLKLNFPVYSVLVSFISMELIACVFRILFLKKIAGLSIEEYYNSVFAKEIIPILTSIITCWVIISFIDFSFRFILTCIVSTIFFMISIYFTGLSNDEKHLMNNLLSKNIFYHRNKKNNINEK
jgi:hypothetical protein